MIVRIQSCKMKKLLLTLSLAILGCSFPCSIDFGDSHTDSNSHTDAYPHQTPLAPPELGTEKNPLILALAPSPHPSAEMIAAGEVIAAFSKSRTGYQMVTVAPVF